MPTTMKLIAKNVLGSDTATVTFSDIPGTYTDLVIVMSARTAFAGVVYQNLTMTFNSNTTGYSRRVLYGDGFGAASASASSVGNFSYMYAPAANATADTFGSIEVYVPNYAGSTNKSISAVSVAENNGTSAIAAVTAGLWANTAAITSLTIADADSANLKSGSSFYLYGITKA